MHQPLGLRPPVEIDSVRGRPVPHRRNGVVVLPVACDGAGGGGVGPGAGGGVVLPERESDRRVSASARGVLAPQWTVVPAGVHPIVGTSWQIPASLGQGAGARRSTVTCAVRALQIARGLVPRTPTRCAIKRARGLPCSRELLHVGTIGTLLCRYACVVGDSASVLARGRGRHRISLCRWS